MVARQAVLGQSTEESDVQSVVDDPVLCEFVRIGVLTPDATGFNDVISLIKGSLLLSERNMDLSELLNLEAFMDYRERLVDDPTSLREYEKLVDKLDPNLLDDQRLIYLKKQIMEAVEKAKKNADWVSKKRQLRPRK